MKDLSVYDISRTQVQNIINDWIFSRRDRMIMTLYYLDGLTYQQVANEVDMSERQVKNIVYKHEQVFFRELSKASRKG